MKKAFFSIIVVCLNPEEKLIRTLESIKSQTFSDYEVIVKDGGSSDGTDKVLADYSRDGRLRIFAEKDRGIYDAMNQAVLRALGTYVIFLNCGDSFYDTDVLNHVNARITQGGNVTRGVFYGDVFFESIKEMVYAQPKLTDFGCYRNFPCHQSCFYHRDYLSRKIGGRANYMCYDLRYRIRADYEHFLWCYFKKRALFNYLGFTVASYEGGGFSESKENRKRCAAEHRAITKTYIPTRQLRKYRLIMALTLAPLRTFIAERSALAPIYQGLKRGVYGFKIS